MSLASSYTGLAPLYDRLVAAASLGAILTMLAFAFEWLQALVALAREALR